MSESEESLYAIDLTELIEQARTTDRNRLRERLNNELPGINIEFILDMVYNSSIGNISRNSLDELGLAIFNDGIEGLNEEQRLTFENLREELSRFGFN